MEEAGRDQHDARNTAEKSSHDMGSRVFRDHRDDATSTSGVEKSNGPFLTQLAQGNTREHLVEGDERGVDQSSVLAGTPACVAWDGGGEVPGLTYFSFSLEGVDLVSRAMKPKVTVETDCTFCTLHKTVLHSFVLGWEWGSGPPGSGSAALSWEVVEVEGRCGQEGGGELVADGSLGANPQPRRFGYRATSYVRPH